MYDFSGWVVVGLLIGRGLAAGLSAVEVMALKLGASDNAQCDF